MNQEIKNIIDNGNGTRTIIFVDGSSYLDIPDTAKISLYDYPRYNPIKAEEYVTGILNKKTGETGVLYRQQNGYKYNAEGNKIIDKGKHVEGDTGIKENKK